MTRYVHTNIVAGDARRLVCFYKDVFGCKSIGETRDLSGGWLDRLTGLENAHVAGEHLLLPGYDETRPTLEIFSYDLPHAGDAPRINRRGLAHLAFEVDDVAQTLKKVLEAGGGQLGELVTAEYAGGRRGTFVYATDPEGNIVELQSW
jgi:catechol 2,3-dioxygenase-like lactoylglutathione lyase family enzyme